MCGIAGFLKDNPDSGTLAAMTETLRHRGPDASGSFFEPDDGIGLGHRRLSILDLTEAGNQPFRSADGRHVMIYNGEVYNFREIAKELGLSLRTRTDTEVVLEGFALQGHDIFPRLNGMFALAIWDRQTKTLTLARDRMGIKPLFLTGEANDLRFGSEIKAILASGTFRPSVQNAADFLYLGYLPGEETLYEGIRKFPAGCHGTYRKGQQGTVRPFWQPETHWTEPVSMNAEQARDRLTALLTESVRYRMISDVPLGTFLSGGIDSSTVTAVAQSISDRPVRTFSIGFKDSKFNEAGYAAAVAEHLGTEHCEEMLTERDALDLLETALDVYDEPFADSSAIPTMLVSEIARRHVTVCLSGDGGDELFMGYGSYTWAARLHRPAVRMLRRPVGAVLDMGNNRMKRAARLFDRPDSGRLKSHIFSQEQYFFTAAELRDEMLAAGMPSDLHIDESVPDVPGRTARDRQAFFDLKNYLKDDLLVKVDRASMFHSLEVRVPLLDHRIVEFALSLPENLKVRNGETKFLLKEVLYRYLPRELFQRPKWGFGIPLHTWLKTELRYLVDRYLDPELVSAYGIVRPEAVVELKKRFFGGEDFLYNRIWSLTLLHRWYEKQKS